MTPREALYHVCVALGPQPKTKRDDNLTYQEARLRDAVKVLQNFVTYHADADREIPVSANEYVHHDDYIARPRAEHRGDGKDRIETWKNEWKLK